jgi:hypothetical protein
MIDRQFGKTIIGCDSCDETFIGESGEDFDTVWAAAKREGWSARKIAKEWLHGCPDCGVPT